MLLYIDFFGIPVLSYGVMIIIGCVIGMIISIFRGKINGLEKLDAFAAFLLACTGAFLGGKLFHMIQGLPQFFFLNQTQGLGFYDYFLQAGVVYYGAMIGAIVFIFLHGKIFKIPFFRVCDTLLPLLPLTQVFGRIGCFFVGCCYGVPFEGGIMLNQSLFAPHNVPLLPVQLFEAGGCLVLFLIMMIYGRKPRAEGKILSIYFIGYGLLRFVLEFFRYDMARGFVGSFSVSQWVSLGIIVLGVYFGFFYKKKKMASKTQ